MQQQQTTIITLRSTSNTATRTISHYQRLLESKENTESTMMSRLFAFFAILACTSAFAPTRAIRARSSAVSMSVFDKAVKDWATEYPAAYNVGWGPTTKAERWNGRHAMFGWVALLVTGYCKGHGLIPNPDTLLDLKEWGTLAYLYGGSISNERAIIIVGKNSSTSLRNCFC